MGRVRCVHKTQASDALSDVQFKNKNDTRNKHQNSRTKLPFAPWPTVAKVSQNLCVWVRMSFVFFFLNLFWVGACWHAEEMRFPWMWSLNSMKDTKNACELCYFIICAALKNGWSMIIIGMNRRRPKRKRNRMIRFLIVCMQMICDGNENGKKK